MSGLDWLYWGLVVGLFLALIWRLLRDGKRDAVPAGATETIRVDAGFWSPPRRDETISDWLDGELPAAWYVAGEATDRLLEQARLLLGAR